MIAVLNVVMIIERNIEYQNTSILNSNGVVRQCGQNTSSNLAVFGNLSAVYLDNHGPNIVFNRDIDPEEVIRFIEANFDLGGKTGGPVTV